jgi:predicted nucleotidyltransferase|tara:strand:+ start:2759 stop:4144 length:1386 start_codon:yes stop_codon:yes gene_type:complete
MSRSYKNKNISERNGAEDKLIISTESEDLTQESPRNTSLSSKKSAAHRNPNSPSKKYFYPHRYREILDEINIDDIDFKASGVVKDGLSDTLWDKDQTLKSDVRTALLTAAKDFYEFLKVKSPIRDVVLVGSMAHYTYNETSDIDVHLVIDYDKIDEDEDLVSEFLHAKKTVWNSKYDVRIKGHDIELYAQDSEKTTRSNGEYSIVKNKWNTKPEKNNSKIDVEDVKKKAVAFIGMIEKAEKANGFDTIGKLVDRISDKIWNARSKGLDSDMEELSAANLAFKYLRKKGYLDTLSDLKTKSFNDYISIDEKSVSVEKNKINESKDIEDDENWVTIEGEIRGLTTEKVETIQDFMCFVQFKLNMKEPIKVILMDKKKEGMTTAAYSPYYNENYIVCGGRAMVDILRSIAHELVHNRQRELGLFKVGETVQDIGGDIEGEANSIAGVFIKDYAKNYGNEHIYDI